MAQAEIGIIGGSGLYSMPGFTDVQEVQQQDALRRPFRRLRPRHAGRPQGGFPRASRPRTSHSADRAEFSRQYLWLQAAWGRANRFGVAPSVR